MEQPSEKYPRTMHVPWSPGASNDDKIAQDIKFLLGKDLVITEKLDGSNISLERGALYARSHAGAPVHPSFDVAKSIHAATRQYILPGLQYFGEYCYAVHSIKYEKLPASCFVFAIRRQLAGEPARWLPWDQTTAMTTLLNLTAYGAALTDKLSCVPVIWKGSVATEKQLQDLTERLGKAESRYGGDREGLVVRLASAFSDEDFPRAVAKWVRKNHVTTTEHWKNQKIEKQTIQLD